MSIIAVKTTCIPAAAVDTDGSPFPCHAWGGVDALRTSGGCQREPPVNPVCETLLSGFLPPFSPL